MPRPPRADDGPDPVPGRLLPWGPPPALRPVSPVAAKAVLAVYGDVEAALGDGAATCRACGACCRFDRTRPVLFASLLEMALLLGEPPPAGADPIDPGEPDAPWRCPYQVGDACTARERRPLGCRTYFCDPAARAEGEALYEGTLARLRAIAREAGVPWWYGPARVFHAEPS